jgi:hypothetical protein
VKLAEIKTGRTYLCVNRALLTVLDRRRSIFEVEVFSSEPGSATRRGTRGPIRVNLFARSAIREIPRDELRDWA